GVPCCVIGPHGACGVGYTNALHGPGIVSRKGLPFNYRHPFDAEDFACNRSPAAQNASERRALAHFLDKPDGPLGVSKLEKARFHGNPNGCPHLDGIQTVVIVEKIEHGYRIQIADAAIAPVGPYGFILRLLCQIMAVLVIVSPRATDDTSPVAAVGC